ncbi:5'-nucleosidase, partial [Acinetobacter nosocomialis]
GSAGSSSFNRHDLVEVKTFVQRDLDVSPLGFEVGVTPLDDYFPAAIHLQTHFADLPKGICGTGDSFETGQPKVACDVVDMEGYA